MRLKKLLFLFSIILFLSFIYFSYLVAIESFTQIDFDTTVKLQDRLSRGWDLPFSVLSVIGSAEITGLIWLGVLIFALLKRYWLTLVALPTFFLALIIELYGKLFVHHPGPPFLFYRGVIDFDFPSHFVHTDYSYPSGHMTRTAFLVAFFLVFLHFKSHWSIRWLLQLGLIIFLVAMVISRIYLGEHWFSDVIGGLLLGVSAGLLTGATIPLNRKDGLSHQQ